MTRWLSYCLFTLSFATAVLLKGGVYPQQWQWSAAGIAVASILLFVSSRAFPAGSYEPAVSNALLSLLLAWMVFQLVPLPMSLVERLSPHRWQALVAARAATGQNAIRWAALSLAPAASAERLLDVVPAMAVFVTARQMGWWLRDRMWIATAPVVCIAWAESALGLIQFYSMRGGGLKVGSATGTYVNRNHFAGLLELAFPLALMWSISVWRSGVTRPAQTTNVALRAALLLGMAACILAGIVVSLSRMGFLSTIIAAGVTLLMLFVAGRFRKADDGRMTWGWLIPFIPLLAALWLLPTRELTERLGGMTTTAELSTDNRIDIWRDTLRMAPAYTWVGCGLGAYEKGMYAYKTVAPTNTLDFAHNDYLQVFVELGVIGTALAGGLLGWILWRAAAVVLRERRSRNWELAMGLFAALLSLSFHSLADFNLYIPANALVFAWLGGLAVSPGLRDS
jgi:O-antigen ligase